MSNDRLYRLIAKRADEEMTAGRMRRGALHFTEVLHDEWCRLINGVGGCNCNPDISVTEMGTEEIAKRITGGMNNKGDR